MTTAETVLAALQTTLAGAGLGASVERSRAVALEREDLPAVVIRPKAEESTPIATGLLRCTLSVEIQVHTRGDVPDSLADPVAAGIDAAIRASATLGGLVAKSFRSAKEWEFTDSDGTGGQLTLIYQFHYTEPA